MNGSEIQPVTEAELTRDLARLGAEPGSTLVVHSSLSKIGWVEGGAPAVVRALIAAIGPEGNLAMPAATLTCVELFDRRETPTAMGAIAEAFRNWPDTLRSEHPVESVCARGPQAALITGEHPLAFSEGPGSPFAKLHDLDARILLLGVGFHRCTALHFAETLACNRRIDKVRFPVVKNGRKVWVEVENVADDNGVHFPIIGERFLREGLAAVGTIGQAESILCSMRELVDFAVPYFESELGGVTAS